MTISKIHIDIIKTMRKALRESYSFEEGGHINKHILIEEICRFFLKEDYTIIKGDNVRNNVVDILLYHFKSNKYVIIELKPNESKRNINFSTATYKKIYELINSSKEDVDALIFVFDNPLQYDTIYYLAQEKHSKNSIVDLVYSVRPKVSDKEFRVRGNAGLYTKKISPAYYIGDEETIECFIKRIEIKNYKFFSDERIFHFNDRFSVLIGDNSSGKTSLLDAVRASLKSLLSNMGNKRHDKAYSNGKNINLRYIANKHKIEFDSTPIIRLSDVHQNTQEKAHPTELQCYVRAINNWTEWNHEKKAGSVRFRRLKSEQAINYAMDLYELANEKENKQVILPIFAYYGIHRTYDKHSKFPKLTLTRTDGYANCLDAQTSYSFFKEWFRTFEQNPHILKCFKDTILKCLQSEHIINIEYRKEIEVDGKISRLDDFILTRKVENLEEHILMSNLSAGYKIVCSMVADMAYRCLQLNTPLDNNDNPIEHTYGLVLIDELDMHLHPLWQRHIVNDLMRCFPRIQFITTTHSPFIVQSLNRKQVITLQPKECNDNVNYLLIDPCTLNINDNSRLMGVVSQYSNEETEKRSVEYKLYKMLQEENPDEQTFNNTINAYKLLNNPDPYFIAHLSYEEKKKLEELGLDIEQYEI